MTDTRMEDAIRTGMEDVIRTGMEEEGELQKKKSYLNIYIIGILILVNVIMGWQLYEFFTPDPWYVHMNPF